MIKRKSGFTLMEIMVVIIVIAVLASVAGPMIGSITDQGRASATKSKLSNLKSALVSYQSDVGRFPYSGNSKDKKSAYNQEAYLGNSEDTNVLVCETNLINIKNYSRKWKGPYMDSDPSDFMVDAWGNDIIYIRSGKNLYLWSYGPDGSADSDVDAAFKAQGKEGSEGDDIVISVSKFKKSAN